MKRCYYFRICRDSKLFLKGGDAVFAFQQPTDQPPNPFLKVTNKGLWHRAWLPVQSKQSHPPLRHETSRVGKKPHRAGPGQQQGGKTPQKHHRNTTEKNTAAPVCVWVRARRRLLAAPAGLAEGKGRGST